MIFILTGDAFCGGFGCICVDSGEERKKVFFAKMLIEVSNQNILLAHNLISMVKKHEFQQEQQTETIVNVHSVNHGEIHCWTVAKAVAELIA